MNSYVFCNVLLQFLSFRILKEQREWIVSLLEAGHTNRSIVAQGASRYFGPPLNKIHMLTERYLRRLASELQARTDKTIGPGMIDVPVRIQRKQGC